MKPIVWVLVITGTAAFYMWVPVALTLMFLGFVADERYLTPAVLMFAISTLGLWLAWVGARAGAKRASDNTIPTTVDWTQN